MAGAACISQREHVANPERCATHCSLLARLQSATRHSAKHRHADKIPVALLSGPGCAPGRPAHSCPRQRSAFAPAWVGAAVLAMVCSSALSSAPHFEAGVEKGGMGRLERVGIRGSTGSWVRGAVRRVERGGLRLRGGGPKAIGGSDEHFSYEDQLVSRAERDWD